MATTIVENLPTIYNTFTGYVNLEESCSELSSQLQQMENRKYDMIEQLKFEEASNLCNKQKNYVGHYFERIGSFHVKAIKTLEDRRGARFWNRIILMLKVERLLKNGKMLLKQADQLMNEGLTCYEVYTRGMRLPVGELIGKTPRKLQAEALQSIRSSRFRIIGIHGNRGAGKTNLMKFLYNDVYDDPKNFKAVFWAGWPREQQPDIKSIQDCVAEALQFKLEDEDSVRRSGLLAKKLKDMAPGHIVLFLDNVKKPFLMTEVGIPIGFNEAEGFCCTLVFTAASEDICNKMRCSSKFKLDLLPESEARELFLHEANRDNHCTPSYSQSIEKVANDVAKQCARMPLVITLIARSMTGKEELCEWSTRLNELMGIIEDMDGDEAKIIEQLKFSYNCIPNPTIQGCFLDAASVLFEGHQLSTRKLIQHWIENGRIRSKCRRSNSSASAIYDCGHSIIIELQRLYLLEVIELDGSGYVSMNKWIRKMAENVLPPEEDLQ